MLVELLTFAIMADNARTIGDILNIGMNILERPVVGQTRVGGDGEGLIGTWPEPTMDAPGSSCNTYQSQQEPQQPPEARDGDRG
jgi:hypothetical protein